MAQYLEIAMILSFGASWPMNVMKSYKARTTQGKSLSFLILILFGYICGIAGKLMAESINWFVLFFYILNAVMVATDLALYARNYKLDQARKEESHVS
jgi:hypothetical protein